MAPHACRWVCQCKIHTHTHTPLPAARGPSACCSAIRCHAPHATSRTMPWDSDVACPGLSHAFPATATAGCAAQHVLLTTSQYAISSSRYQYSVIDWAWGPPLLTSSAPQTKGHANGKISAQLPMSFSSQNHQDPDHSKAAHQPQTISPPPFCCCQPFAWSL